VSNMSQNWVDIMKVYPNTIMCGKTTEREEESYARGVWIEQPFVHVDAVLISPPQALIRVSNQFCSALLSSDGLQHPDGFQLYCN
jgi:hypothetical protein